MQLRPAALPVLAVCLLLGACSPLQSASPAPSAEFLTATLPSTSTLQATDTALPATPLPTSAPVEGTTTTQLNVRSEPSTGGQSLGLLDAFAKIQITARDAGGNWYQILYPSGPAGKGWVTAKYVQAAGAQAIPTLGGANGGQAGPPGVVTQQVNVRSGPGTSFETLGTLNPQDSVTLTGKNTDGTWLRIAFSSGAEGQGWIAAGYVQSSAIAGLPIISEQGQLVGTGTPGALPDRPTATVVPAAGDGDSASSPGASLVFSPSGAGALQLTNDVSVPEGDPEDWVAFVPYSQIVSIRLECQGSGSLAAELWQGAGPLSGFAPIRCGEQKEFVLTPGGNYLLHVHVPDPGPDLQYTRFVLKITNLR